MRVTARPFDLGELPRALVPFVKPGQVSVTAGREYDVHAMTVFQGYVKLQIVDDLGYPTWRPAWLFDVVDPSIPNDWIASAFRTEPSLVVGPPFLARDLDAYARMVQLESTEVHLFWKRLESLAAARQENEDGRP